MMRNRALFLFVMAATVLVSSQAWAHDLPQPSVDGERKVYNRSGQALVYDPSGDQSGWTERTLPDRG